jgi:hypothetical protein
LVASCVLYPPLCDSYVIFAVYGVLTELPAVYILYDSSFWSGIFLVFIFAVSVWNGGGFYIEVFGRKYVSIFRACFASERSRGLSSTLFLDSSVNWKRFERSWRNLRPVQVLSLRLQTTCSAVHQATTSCQWKPLHRP